MTIYGNEQYQNIQFPDMNFNRLSNLKLLIIQESVSGFLPQAPWNGHSFPIKVDSDM